MNENNYKVTKLLGRRYLAMGMGAFSLTLLLSMCVITDMPNLVLFFLLIDLVPLIVFIFQIYYFAMKAYVSNHGTLKKGLIIERKNFPLCEYSTFLVEFENDNGEICRTKFTYKTVDYIHVNDDCYVGYDTGVEYDTEDYIPVFVYKNYAYYNRSKLYEMQREAEILRKREDRLSGR